MYRLINKELAIKAHIDLLYRKDFTVFGRYWSEPYLQHNPLLESGIAAVRASKEKFVPIYIIKIMRVIVDDNIVAFHQHVTGYPLVPDIIDLDIYKVVDGKIVEHWDVMQLDMRSDGSQAMLDRPTEIADREKTEVNRRIITDFMNKVVLSGKSDTLADFVHENVIQHDPRMGDGIHGMKAFYSHRPGAKHGTAYTKLNRVLTEGNFAITVSEGTTDNKPYVLYDIWRLENEKIFEHWGLTQEILEVTKSDLPMILE